MNNRSHNKVLSTHQSDLHPLQGALRQIREQRETFHLMKALTDPTKLSIFLLLNQVEDLPVKDISAILDLSSSVVSHALADLKKLGLVDCRSCGQLRCYFLKPQVKERESVLQLFHQTFIKSERNEVL